MSGLTVAAIVAAVAFAASTWLVGRIRSLGVVDHPNDRSSHSTPTPRGGGVAIAALTLAGIAGFALLIRGDLSPLYGFLAGGLLVACVSFVDDLKGLSAAKRMATHLAAAATVIVTVGHPSQLQVGRAHLDLGMLTLAVVLVWTVGLTNAFNFMDGIDGIAAGQAIVAGLGWAIAGAVYDEPILLAAGALIAASTSGFLVHNWPPASIFMGDVGSAFLGFAFAALPMVASDSTRFFPLPAILFVWPFVFDASFTFLRRLRRRENVFAAHRSHLYQRLTIAGFSHGTVSAAYTVLAVFGVAGGLWIMAAPSALPVVACAVAAGAFALWASVARIEGRRKIE